MIAARCGDETAKLAGLSGCVVTLHGGNVTLLLYYNTLHMVAATGAQGAVIEDKRACLHVADGDRRGTL